MNKTSSKQEIKILVVDDNLLNRKLASAVLKGCNIDHDLAENGKMAFEYFLSGKYDLILMDIQMPILNGIECTQKIRMYESEKNLSSIPIIAVTTFTMTSDKKNCFDAGMNDILAKPYKTMELVEKIKNFINID